MSSITTDFHCHILPGADHGSDSVKTSIEQLALIASAGIKRAVATPHFYPTRDNVATFLNRRDGCARALRDAMKVGDPDIILGCEVLVCEGIENMEGLDRLTVYGTNCILLEMPMTRWSTRLFETIEAISDLGLVPIMAHIDRYNPKYVAQLLELDVRCQLNPDAFATRSARKLSEKWLSDGKIVAVGSDLHQANEREYKQFVNGIKVLGEYAPYIEKDMLALLQGAKIIRIK